MLAREVRDPECDFDESEWDVYETLCSRGLCVEYEHPDPEDPDDPWVYFRATPLARIALDCYRAARSIAA